MGSQDGGSRIGRKAGLGAIGLTTIAGQYWFAVYLRSEIRHEVHAAASSEITAVRRDVSGSALEREREFVRKRDLEQMGTRIDRNIDSIGDRIEDLTDRTAQLEGYLRGRDQRMTEERARFWKRAIRRAK